MEDSFELLSSMSPRVKGRQKTIKVKKVSKLAVRKHFRRSSVFDKSLPVRDENLAIAEVNSESSESIASSKELIKSKDENGIIIIDSTDSEDEGNFPKKIPPKGVDRIQQWLHNVEEGKKTATFFSQVSTIYGDEISKLDNNCDNKIAACSSFNEPIIHRFDELFISKGKELNVEAKEDNLSDSSFSLGIDISLSSKLKQKGGSIKNTNEQTKSIKVINESLLTDDESILKASPQRQVKKTNAKEEILSDDSFSLGINTSLNSKLKQTGKFQGTKTPPQDNCSLKKKIVSKSTSECVKTPSGQSIQEVESLLDSFYGKKWRTNQQNVLLPMSEPKKKEAKSKIQTTHCSTSSDIERDKMPKVKKHLLNDVQPSIKRLNFDRLKKPVQSPWMQRLKGIVDSDSDSNEGTDDSKLKSTKPKGLDMVKMKLNFHEDEIPEESIKMKKNGKKQTKKTDDEKENNLNLANKKPSKSVSNNTKKTTKTRSSSSSSTKSCSEDDVSTDEEYDKEIEILEIKRKSLMPANVKTYSFLQSLSGSVPLNKCNVSARIFRSNFKEFKTELTQTLFTLFNEKVFDNAIPKDTELEWNVNLRKTAGLCYCKKITHRGGTVERKVKIGLSTKVLDSSDRLRDTLIHEMCHAATWIVNQISNGHGAYWKSWAFKAMETFPELPPIQRCHSFAINSKYTYKCTGCGYSFGRHSKSLDIERKRCGHCYGKFEVLLNKTTKQGEIKTVPVTPRKQATGFALFVKENYARYKDPTKKHGDVMRVLGQKFAELKVKNV